MMYFSNRTDKLVTEMVTDTPILNEFTSRKPFFYWLYAPLLREQVQNVE